MSMYDNYSGSPYTLYDEFDDTRCANCGAELPEYPAEGTPQFDGFCSDECADGQSVPCVRAMFNLLRYELDRDTPEGWSRAIYKATSCGAWLSLDSADTISIGSIVEGCDYDAESQTLTWPFTREQFWAAVQAVEDDADAIWNNTHGCEKCAELLGVDYDCGDTPVADECPECGGHGEAI